MSIDLGEAHPELTDPLHHNDNKFCYLVHAVQGEVANIQGEYRPSEHINLLERPDLISSRSALSTSAINELKNYTTSDSFFILKVPNGNFIEEGSSDLLFSTVSHIGKTPGVLDRKLADIIAGNGLLKHNEVVVAGEYEGHKIEIVGIGIKRREKNKFRIDSTGKRMQEIGQELGVPVIDFEIYNGMKEETIINERLQGVLSSIGGSSSLTKGNVEGVSWRDSSLKVEDSQFIYTFVFNGNQSIIVEKKEIDTNKVHKFKLLDYLTIRKYIVSSIGDNERKRNMLLKIDTYFESPEYLQKKS